MKRWSTACSTLGRAVFSAVRCPTLHVSSSLGSESEHERGRGGRTGFAQCVAPSAKTSSCDTVFRVISVSDVSLSVALHRSVEGRSGGLRVASHGPDGGVVEDALRKAGDPPRRAQRAPATRARAATSPGALRAHLSADRRVWSGLPRDLDREGDDSACFPSSATTSASAVSSNPASCSSCASVSRSSSATATPTTPASMMEAAFVTSTPLPVLGITRNEGWRLDGRYR